MKSLKRRVDVFRENILRVEKPSLLIDTTFLLPALGVEIEEEAMNVIRYFDKFKIYYTRFGLLEAMWKIIGIVPKKYLDRIRIGLEAIKNTYYLLETPVEAYIEAYKILSEGHRDYIDALYYGVSQSTKTPFLTIDHEFIDFLEKHGYDISLIYTPQRTIETMKS